MSYPHPPSMMKLCLMVRLTYGDLEMIEIKRSDEFKNSNRSLAEYNHLLNLSEGYSDVLRGLAAYVGNGGFNALSWYVSPEVFDAKIRDGIDRLTGPLESLISDLREDRVKLQAENEQLRFELRQREVKS